MAQSKKKGQPVELDVDPRGPRQRVWEAIRWLAADPGPGTFTAVQLVERAKVGKQVVTFTCRALRLAGYLEIVGKTASRTDVMRLVRDNGIEMPRIRDDGTPSTFGLAQEQMWRTLSLLSGDTNEIELAAHASTPSVTVTRVAACKFLYLLARGGFVQRTKEAKPGNTGWPARFRLIRRTGPKPPVVLAVHAIYDPNLQQVVALAPTSIEEVVDVNH